MNMGLKQSDTSSPNAAPGVQFSEEKQSRVIPPLSIGDGILAAKKEERSDSKTDQHLKKATNLLDELKAEEHSGFKASMSLDGSKEKQSDRYEEEFEEIDEDLPD